MTNTFKTLICSLMAVLAVCSSPLPSQAASQAGVQRLWYRDSAEYFINALPIGNGRVGAMVYGRPADDIINLNEETLWAGGPVGTKATDGNPDAARYLPQIRAAINAGDYALADKLSCHLQGTFTQSYAPAGDLLVHQELHGKATDYYRDLDLTNAIATVGFTVGDTRYTREMFVSAPDQVMVLHYESSAPKGLDLTFSLQSLLQPAFASEKGILTMKGRAPSHADPTYHPTSATPVKWEGNQDGMRFEVQVKVLDTDGHATLAADKLNVKDASRLTVAVSIATSFNGFDKHPYSEGIDQHAKARRYLLGLKNKPYKTLRSRHADDYRRYYDRVSLHLAGNPARESLPTDLRLAEYQNDNSDHGLEALLYNYGRYLLISSSRRDGIAANLQGIWNKDLQPAWSCNYTVNINLEMNYWAADKVGLEDMSWPLVRQVQNMSKTGTATARNFYGCGGWAAGHNSDIWAMTCPVGHFGAGSTQWACWNMGGVWLCQNVWDKYAYSADTDYLRHTAYPLMKGAARFCLDWLVHDPSGYLVTSPSTSPENRYMGLDGKSWAVTKAATMDIALIRNLFQHVMQASATLGIDKAFADSVRTAYGKLPPYRIGKRGNLQEWMDDYDDADPRHRHVSHLAALHPGTDISAWDTPQLFEACKQTLMARGDDGTGWARCWKICFWARLLDGDHAYSLLKNDLKRTVERGFSEDGGTYPNLLNACPPYQIDGNFGVVEGITEMLLQSHLGELHLLPALPKAWHSGCISGIKGRGGYTASIEWKDNQLLKATIASATDGVCRIRTSVPIFVDGSQPAHKMEHTAGGTFYVYDVAMSAGRQYAIDGIKPLVMDMVHHNPGEPLYESIYNDPKVLKAMGYNAKCFFLFDSPTLAINWDGYDKDIMPEGSPEREWVELKAARLHKLYNECKDAGIDVYAMSDLVLMPKRLVEKYHLQDTYGKPLEPKTQELLRYQIQQTFKQFPQMDGLVVRIGETYLHDAPYHIGNIRDKGDADKCIIPLISLLRDEICVKLGKKLVFRTWWTFDTDIPKYEYVASQIEPHPNLTISIKHCEGDFHRANPFSKVLGHGRHNQVIEVQCAREYESKGAYPNYVARGVIDGFEEHASLRQQGKPASLRDLSNAGHTLGVWTWTRGGGWEGPYIKDELWCDLNAWILAQWALDTTLDEATLFDRYCTQRLGLGSDDIRHLRQIALLSEEATLLGQYSRAYPDKIPGMWLRDSYITFPRLPDDSQTVSALLGEKDRAVELWQQICRHAGQISSGAPRTQEAIKATCQYGLCMYRIYRDVFYISASTQQQDIDRKAYIDDYDDAWAQIEALQHAYPSICPSPYTKTIIRRCSTDKIADREIDRLR